MEKSITVTAAGKINLSLRVTGQRHDGYHTIDTVMHETGLHDTITITLGGEGITVDCPGDIEPQSNLAYRAACAYLDACGAETGVHIAIEKHIPVSGGMAGGSADAAAVLRGLDSLIGTVGKERLYGAALSLGADVPFCLAGGAMRCTGMGEIMTPCRPLPPHKLMIVGGCGEKRSTAAMYSELDRRLGRGADGCGGENRIDIGGDMVQQSKPHPEIYQTACAAMEVPPACAYAVEDSYNGIRAAARAGMHPIMIPDLLPPTPEMEQLAEQIFPDMAAFQAFLKASQKK